MAISLASVAASAAPHVAPSPTPPSAAATPTFTLQHDQLDMPVAPAGLLEEVDQVVHLPTGIDDPAVATGGHGLHLPNPPKPGGLIEKAELTALHVLQDHRTPERDAWAREMAAAGAGKVLWAESKGFRQDVGFLKGWAGTAVAAGAVGASFVAAGIEKHHFGRARPYEADPTIVPVVPIPHGSSYPSGHTTVAFAAARVFGQLDPGNAKQYYGLAAQVGASRIYGGVHFPTDVAAGAALGTAFGEVAARMTPWLRTDNAGVAAAPVDAPAAADVPAQAAAPVTAAG